MRALILAGGKGERLRPFTENTPKPILPVFGEESMLSIILKQLARDGFEHVTISLNYLGEKVMEYCGDGSKWGIAIDYVREDAPLSTIGPVTLMQNIPEHVLIVNGDILAKFDFKAFYDAHTKSGCRISIATTVQDLRLEFLRVSVDEKQHLTSFDEKPVFAYQVANGMTCLSGNLIRELPQNGRYGLDDLLKDALSRKEKVFVHASAGFWMDIGRPKEYEYVREHPEILEKII